MIHLGTILTAIFVIVSLSVSGKTLALCVASTVFIMGSEELFGLAPHLHHATGVEPIHISLSPGILRPLGQFVHSFLGRVSSGVVSP